RVRIPGPTSSPGDADVQPGSAVDDLPPGLGRTVALMEGAHQPFLPTERRGIRQEIPERPLREAGETQAPGPDVADVDDEGPEPRERGPSVDLTEDVLPLGTEPVEGVLGCLGRGPAPALLIPEGIIQVAVCRRVRPQRTVHGRHQVDRPGC